MQVGMIGLGRMGSNMVRRLMRDHHTCSVYDTTPAAVQALVAEGATGATTLHDFATRPAALFGRFASRGQAEFQTRLRSAMRSEFGGHAEKRDAR